MDTRAVVILSNDVSKDLWDPFAINFQRAWPNCPYKVYFITNQEVFEKPGFINIKTGPRLDWAGDWAFSFRQALNQIKEERILVLLDDFIIRAPNLALIESAFENLQLSNLDCIHLKNDPKMKIPADQIYGVYKPDQPYQANLAAFWKKKTLVSLLADGENPWDFEIQGSKRLGRIGRSAALKYDCLSYLGLVEKGKWVKNIKSINTIYNLNLELTARPKQNKFTIIHFLKKVWFNFMINHVSYKFRIAFSNFIKRVFVSY